jgi:hypothetical protein
MAQLMKLKYPGRALAISYYSPLCRDGWKGDDGRCMPSGMVERKGAPDLASILMYDEI